MEGQPNQVGARAVDLDGIARLIIIHIYIDDWYSLRLSFLCLSSHPNPFPPFSFPLHHRSHPSSFATTPNLPSPCPHKPPTLPRSLNASLASDSPGAASGNGGLSGWGSAVDGSRRSDEDWSGPGWEREARVRRAGARPWRRLGGEKGRRVGEVGEEERRVIGAEGEVERWRKGGVAEAGEAGVWM